jgi:hypothetical protein
MVIIMLATALPAAPPAASAPAQKIPDSTRVTLHEKNVPATQAFERLFAQAGLQLRESDSALAEKRVSVDLVDQPFLVALVELSRQAHVEPSISSVPAQRIHLSVRDHARVLRRAMSTTYVTSTGPATTRATTGAATRRSRPRGSPGPSRFTTRPVPEPWLEFGPTTTMPSTRPSWVDAPYIVHGAFLIAPREARRSSTLSGNTLAKSPHQSLYLVLQTMCDPGLIVYAIANELRVEVAEDDAGNSLLPPPREINVQQTQSNIWMWTTFVNLAPAPRPGGKLALLRGKLSASVVTRMESITLDNLDGQIGMRQAADVQVIFGKLEKKNSETQLAVTVPRRGYDDESWKELRGSLDSRGLLEATDGSGRRMWAAVHWWVQNSTTLEGYIRFSAYQEAGAAVGSAVTPAKLVWRVPVEVSDVEIPVEFCDLLLP